MKRPILFFIVFSLLCKVSYSQQRTIRLQGRVINNENIRPLKLVNVVNKRGKNIVITDTLGNFSIDAIKGDTLHFSALGFQNKVVHVNDSLIAYSKSVLIFLSQRKYQLKEVIIEGFGEYSDFKKKFYDLNIKADTLNLGLPKAKPGLPMLLDDKYIKSIKFLVNSPVSFSPISYLFYNLNKKEKSKRKVVILEKDDKIQELADQKYNKQKLANWTGLKDEELTNFFLFCNFSKDYVLQNSELDIMIKVNENLKIFKGEHPANKN